MRGSREWEPSVGPGEALRTCQFLRGGGELNELEAEFGLRSRRDKTLPCVLLKYQQLSAPFQKAITRECRGLVLEEKTWKVLAYPYEKFFNVGEKMAGLAPPIDWSTARCYEKLDGSLATLYYFSGQWRVASSGTPTGDGLLTEKETFADVFWEIWAKEKYEFPARKDVCYIFEMIAKKNPIVVVVEEDEIVLHGARNLTTLQEMRPEPVAKENKWKCVKSYPLNSLDALEKACRALNPHKNEGFVVVDETFQRRKLKSPAYVGLSLLSAKDMSNNDSNMLRIVRQNEADEFTAYYPQWACLCEYVRERYLTTMSTMTKRYLQPMQEEAGDVAACFRNMRKQKLERKAEADLAIREWFAGIEMKRALELLDFFAPEDSVKRSNMLRRQAIVFEKLGIDTKKKKKKKKGGKNKAMPDAGNYYEEDEDEAPMVMIVAKSPKNGGTSNGGGSKNNSNNEWEVVSRKKSRNKKKDSIDKLIEEFRQADLKKKPGKRK